MNHGSEHPQWSLWYGQTALVLRWPHVSVLGFDSLWLFPEVPTGLSDSPGWGVWKEGLPVEVRNPPWMADDGDWNFVCRFDVAVPGVDHSLISKAVLLC